MLFLEVVVELPAAYNKLHMLFAAVGSMREAFLLDLSLDAVCTAENRGANISREGRHHLPASSSPTMPMNLADRCCRARLPSPFSTFAALPPCTLQVRETVELWRRYKA